MDGWEVQQVILRVARCADRSDISGMMDHFADSAVLEVGERRVEGRDSIFEFFGGGASASGSGGAGSSVAGPASERTKHVISNSLIDTDPHGEGLAATSYFQVLRSWGIANWGRYEDRLIADAGAGGAWKIVHRRVVVDGNVPRPERPA